MAWRRRVVGGGALAVGCWCVWLSPFLPHPRVWPYAFRNFFDKSVSEGCFLLAGGGPGGDVVRSGGRRVTVSVIVPVYNEGSGSVVRFLSMLEARTIVRCQTEFIFVDAGCSDGSFAGVGDFGPGFRVVRSGKGRGVALQKGASVATGDVLFFLHADGVPPSGYDGILRCCLVDDTVAVSAFRFGVDCTSRDGVFSRRLGRVSEVTNLRSKYLWLPYGDQGFAMRSCTYRELGGFRPFDMMEDFDFIRRARDFALENGKRIVTLDGALYSSARRWEVHGVWDTTFRNWIFVSAYVFFGVSPSRIYSWYYGR